MALSDVKRSWNKFGQRDPLWAILADPEKVANKWDLGDFFETGRRDVAGLLALQAAHGLPEQRRRALDFGCGVGRITQSLAPHFDECYGVDIAPSMIRLARRYNQAGRRCRYAINDAPDLRLFPSNFFDLVFSVIVLQHMEPRYSRKYIEEFVRVLAPGGLIAFQIPSASVIAVAAEKTEPSKVELAPSACRARITLALQQLELSPGESAGLRICVENIGDFPWPAAYVCGQHQIQVGNHWRDRSGKLLQADDGRAPLARGITPGQRDEVMLIVRAPQRPGYYELELDVVQEHVGWFHDRGGSATPRLPVRVRGWGRWVANMVRGFADGAEPHMEMHGVPREEVIALIEKAGGRVIEVVLDELAPGWVSSRYLATVD